MSIFSDLASSEPARWGLPLALFGSVFSAFKLLESQTSKEFKNDLSEFILDSKYEKYFGKLPSIVQDSFNKIMGSKHLSLKSIKRAFLFSMASSFLSISFSLIYNYRDLRTLVLALPENLQKSHDLFMKTPSTVGFASFLLKLQHPGFLFALIPILWISWCFIPDFIALLKTRIIILVLQNSNAKISSLIVVLFVDVIVTIFQFMISIVFFQMIIGYMLYWYYNGVEFNVQLASILFGMVFTFEFAIFVFSGSILFSIPFANVFWASTLPSIWLWTYIISALIARFLISSKYALNRIRYFLDFSEKPISSLGIVAGTIACVGSYFFLIVVSVVR